jgi:hypothetical protein
LRRLLTKSVPVLLIVLSLALAACSSSGGFETYTPLIGMTKAEITDKLKDQPTTIDEGGLTFAKSGIRVWFDESGRAVDVYIDSKGVDFKGAKVGGMYESFTKAFGTPVREDKDSAYAVFAYKGLFLDVNYDSKTSTVVAVHILKEVQ